jgi:hypothetical protein
VFSSRSPFCRIRCGGVALGRRTAVLSTVRRRSVFGAVSALGVRNACVGSCRFCSPLTAAQPSAISALDYAAALVRAAAFPLAADRPYRRRFAVTARRTQRRYWRPFCVASARAASARR